MPPTSGRAREVVSAGAVVLGPGGNVLLVHQPKYDDWSFPKGKLHPGESDEDAALREVEEETGLRCALGSEVGTTRYHDARGRDKVVRYWMMSPVGGVLAAANEVDDAVWVGVGRARSLLTYERDRDLLSRFEEVI